jgi:hypothetical protein
MNRALFTNLAILALRKILPRDWDFCVVAWRMTGDRELEMSTVSQGNPNELELVLSEVLKDLRQDLQQAPNEPAAALH